MVQEAHHANALLSYWKTPITHMPTHLKAASIESLKRIVRNDYGLEISDTEADQVGLSLLRIARLASAAFNRAEEDRSIAAPLQT